MVITEKRISKKNNENYFYVFFIWQRYFTQYRSRAIFLHFFCLSAVSLVYTVAKLFLACFNFYPKKKIYFFFGCIVFLFTFVFD